MHICTHTHTHTRTLTHTYVCSPAGSRKGPLAHSGLHNARAQVPGKGTGRAF